MSSSLRTNPLDVTGANVRLVSPFLLVDPFLLPDDRDALQLTAQAIVNDNEVKHQRTPVQMNLPGWAEGGARYTIDIKPAACGENDGQDNMMNYVFGGEGGGRKEGGQN